SAAGNPPGHSADASRRVAVAGHHRHAARVAGFRAATRRRARATGQNRARPAAARTTFLRDDVPDYLNAQLRIQQQCASRLGGGRPMNKYVVAQNIENILSGKIRVPTIVMWNRLEGRPRRPDFTRALKAEVRDPLWML